jgi:ribosomal protein L11 methylase PrmA
MYELSLLCPEDRVDVLSDALEALDALSVSVEDADAQTPAEQALFGEPGMPPPKDGWQRSRMVALFAREEAAREAAQQHPALLRQCIRVVAGRGKLYIRFLQELARLFIRVARAAEKAHGKAVSA